MTTTYAFNRRTVEDRTVYIRAESLGEAWARARADEADETDDAEIVTTTYRRIGGSNVTRD